SASPARRGLARRYRVCSSTPPPTATRAAPRSRAPTRRISSDARALRRRSRGATRFLLVKPIGGIIGAALALLALWQPSGAPATGEPSFGCGHVHTAEAQRNPFGNGDGPPPIAIGDS